MKKMKKRKRSFKNFKTEKETSQHPWVRTQGDDFVPPNPCSRRLYARNTPDAPFLTIHQLPTLYANTSNHRFDLNSFPMPLTSLLDQKSLWTLLKLLQTFSVFKDYGEQTLMTSSTWGNSDITGIQDQSSSTPIDKKSFLAVCRPKIWNLPFYPKIWLDTNYFIQQHWLPSFCSSWEQKISPFRWYHVGCE